VTAGGVVSLEFHHDDWRGSGTINVIIEQHCCILRQLVDVPLQSLARLEWRFPPAVDSSSARALTHLEARCSWGRPSKVKNLSTALPGVSEHARC